MIGADSLGYLSIEGLRRAVSGKESHCEACFTGDYPVPVQLEMDKLALEQDDLGMEGDSPRGVANVAVFSFPNTDAIEEEARG